MLNIHGPFQSSFGTLTFSQRGSAVSGTYPHEDGRIEGVLDGRTLRGTWVQSPPGKRGPFELTFDDFGNAFQGRWKLDNAADWQGRWDGTRTSLIARESGGSPGTWNSDADGPLLSGPLVGEVSETDARVWIQSRSQGDLTLTLIGPGGSRAQSSITTEHDEWLCGTFEIDGLSPGTTYDYEIEGPGGTTKAWSFRTAPAWDAKKARILFGSCFWNWPDPTLQIFSSMEEEDADLLVLLGDNAYFDDFDTKSEHTMMLAHLRHRNNPTFRKLVASVPTIAVWDDHDFGPNDIDGNYEGKPRAFASFKRMWANRSYGAEGVPGLFSRVRCGPADVILLDERYYRGVGGKHVLGSAQLEWLLDELARSTAPVKMIASSSQMLAEKAVSKGWDCWRKDSGKELDTLLEAISARDIRGVVIGSGDLHMANLLHLPGRSVGGRRGPEFWELTTSPLANDPWKESIAGDPRMVREVIDRTNYGVLDIDLDRAGSEVILALRDERGGTFFEQPISLGDLRVR